MRVQKSRLSPEYECVRLRPTLGMVLERLALSPVERCSSEL